MEPKAGKGASERPGPDWKAALQREREEQQHLLAESYSAVMELTRQLQMSERHWSQEKLQLVERLQGEKQQVEQQVKELQNRLSQVRRDPGAQAAEALRERREPSHCLCPRLSGPPLLAPLLHMPASRTAAMSCSSYSLTVAIRTFFPPQVHIGQASSDKPIIRAYQNEDPKGKSQERFP